jgi:pSer/pThr/pTyr-binding forkhead associated (FHA) protein
MVEEKDNNKTFAEGNLIIQHESENEKQVVTTEDIPNHVRSLKERVGVDENPLLMMLPGQTTPLTFINQESIILGRFDPSTGLAPTVDLIPYFGKSLGVSRRHAEIFLSDGFYYLRDLDSANGTWLNNKSVTSQAQPLKSGDQIRLGELLIVVFLSEKDSQSHITPKNLHGQQSLYVQRLDIPQASPQDSFSMDFLTNTLVGYLQALNAMQMTIFTANKQDPEPLTINRVQVMDKLNAIEIQLYIHPSLLMLLRDNMQKLVNQSKTEVKEALLPMMYRRSAQHILEQLTSIRANDDYYEAYLDRLQRDLQRLFAFDLKLVNVDA